MEVTEQMIERALEAATGAMVDTRRFWTDGDRAAVRAMLESALSETPAANTAKVPSNRTEVIALANEVDQIGEALMSTNKMRGMQLVSLGARIALLAAAPLPDGNNSQSGGKR